VQERMSCGGRRLRPWHQSRDKICGGLTWALTHPRRFQGRRTLHAPSTHLPLTFRLFFTTFHSPSTHFPLTLLLTLIHPAPRRASLLVSRRAPRCAIPGTRRPKYCVAVGPLSVPPLIAGMKKPGFRCVCPSLPPFHNDVHPLSICHVIALPLILSMYIPPSTAYS
jgi:hypothetical protein